MEDNVFSTLQNKLIIDEKYNVMDAALLTANVISQFNLDIKNAVIDWAEGKDVSNFSYNDTTVAEIVDELGCTVFQALCFMNAVGLDADIFMNAILINEYDGVNYEQ